MNYSNTIDLVGVVSRTRRVKTKQYTELRFALRTTTNLGWETTVLCVRRFAPEKKIPPVRKGTWLSVSGTVRLNLSVKGILQAYVELLDDPVPLKEEGDRVMANRIVARGLMHDVNSGNFNEEQLQANFLLGAADQQTGFEYDFCCVVPGEAMKDLKMVKGSRESVKVRGSLMMLYHPEYEESSACCIIADKISIPYRVCVINLKTLETTEYEVG